MYYIIYGLLWLLSILPLRVLYFLSDAFFGLVFYVLKYRLKVVMTNLLIAFPEKTEKERRAIAKKFYHNFLDMMFETIKMITISEKALQKRFTANWDLLNKLYATGKSVQLHVGHNFNWEWGNFIMTKKVNYKLLAVYMPLSSKIMERLFYNLRTRNGATFLRATHMKEDFQPYQNTQYLLGLVADQSPGNPGNAWWFDFFGRKTAFLKGPAKAAKLNDTAIVFAFINKPRRGYYEAVFSSTIEDVQSYSEKELTGMFAKYLEDVIRMYPDMWLWSHRRWKHEWKPEYENNLEK
ncbi:MAG: lipid A biosynthesis acyltransferase [Chitinophagaceae bacterium]